MAVLSVHAAVLSICADVGSDVVHKRGQYTGRCVLATNTSNVTDITNTDLLVPADPAGDGINIVIKR